MNITLEMITFVSLIVAAVMTVVAWRVVRNERVRSAARVAALAADIRDAKGTDDPLLRADAPGVALAPMFTTPRAASTGSPFLVVTVILLVGGALGAAMVVFGTPARKEAAVDTVAESPSRTPARQSPLELIALGHEREADGIVVRGVLRNPSNGAEVDALTAVVVLLGRDGGQVGTGRATVEAAKLLPGGETAFVVTVLGAANIERYRVSFRNDDHVVPHVDRRRS